jgi:peptidoglycan/LPS O-acetylase OafA/YrhL
MTKLYFPAIDGLRALAVLAVIFFHLEFPWFNGGYVGVDIFFVISGYLITRKIMIDSASSLFTFSQFYLARVRRLFPALLVTLLLTLTMGILLLSPDALVRLSSSTIAGILSLANIRFWLVSDYFDIDASLKPLLHLWSLSLEEQFYVFWPVILVLFTKYFKDGQKIFLAISLMTLASFISSQYLIDQRPSLVFYWFPFRAYEFLVGGLLAWFELMRKTNVRFVSIEKNIVGLIGIGMVMYPIIVFDKTTLFPSYASLSPCFGAALIISARNSPIVDRLLNNIIMRSIGKASYSLYLVHWPIWVFSIYWHFQEFSGLEKVIVFGLILVFGYGLYYLVERPFRYHRQGRSHYIYIFVGSLVLLLSSLHIRSDSGWDWRISGHYKVIKSNTVHCKRFNGGAFQKCEFGSKSAESIKVLLLGDSHSTNLRVGLDQFGKHHNVQFESMSLAGCPPLMDVELYSDSKLEANKSCLRFVSEMELLTESVKFDAVILSSRWMRLYEHQDHNGKAFTEKGFLRETSSSIRLTANDSRSLWVKSLTNTINRLKSSVGKVIVFSQYPLLSKRIGECDKSPRYLIAQDSASKRCESRVGYDEIMERIAFTNRTIESLAEANVLTIIPTDHLCDHDTRSCNILTDQGLLYYDESHLSELGGEYLIQSISSELIEYLR